MSITMNASDYKSWEAYKLEDFGDFAERVEYRNEQESGYGDMEGDWFADRDGILENEQGRFYVIYFGTHGNDHSPGASHYTYAELFDADDPDETEEFQTTLKRWEDMPEYLESEEEEEEEEEENEENPRFKVIEYSSGYAVQDTITSEEHWMSDGVDSVFDDDGNPMEAGTEAMRKAWEDSLNANEDETLEAYFPEQHAKEHADD